MKVSVIVPAFNNEKTIETCLSAIRSSIFKDFELIVVDDGSTDKTNELAQKQADFVLRQEKNKGSFEARNYGIENSSGDIIIFIDSDIVVKPTTLAIIVDYFQSHPDVDALTGLLSKSHPNPNFFSQYKNLYMNFIFKKLADRVHFLYGSISSIRRKSLDKTEKGYRYGADTAFGQSLSSKGRNIAFLRDLEVIHLKPYSFFTWILNDFTVPYFWGQIFMQYRGWKQVGRHGTGYAHSPKEQLLSVVLAPMICVLTAAFFHYPNLIYPLLLLFLTWFFLNTRFFVFLKRERGWVFGLFSMPVTFLDHLVMASGILFGFLRSVWR